jgi:hypothetical protein
MFNNQELILMEAIKNKNLSFVSRQIYSTNLSYAAIKHILFLLLSIDFENEDINRSKDIMKYIFSFHPQLIHECISNGETPLFYVCARGKHYYVSFLLNLGADYDTPCYYKLACFRYKKKCEDMFNHYLSVENSNYKLCLQEFQKYNYKVKTTIFLSLLSKNIPDSLIYSILDFQKK